MDIFQKLKELDFPVGEYVVIGSGLLAALGLREASDLDLAVSEKLLKDLRALKKFKEEKRYNKLFLLSEDVEIASQFHWEGYSTTIDEAKKMLLEHDAILITDEKGIAGILTKIDIIKAYSEMEFSD